MGGVLRVVKPVPSDTELGERVSVPQGMKWQLAHETFPVSPASPRSLGTAMGPAIAFSKKNCCPNAAAAALSAYLLPGLDGTAGRGDCFFASSSSWSVSDHPPSAAAPSAGFSGWVPESVPGVLGVAVSSSLQAVKEPAAAEATTK